VGRDRSAAVDHFQGYCSDLAFAFLSVIPGGNLLFARRPTIYTIDENDLVTDVTYPKGFAFALRAKDPRYISPGHRPG
jgi:hypothetical protein